MAYAISDTVRDDQGRPVSDALVYVFSPQGGLATLYNGLGSPLSNPVATNDNGLFEAFSTEDGFHTLKINYGGRERYVEQILLGRDPITEAKEAAAAAEAFTGPAFLSVASGLAATMSGQSFAVTNNGFVTVYRNESGTAIYQRDALTPAALAAPTGASRVGFTLDSVNARALTIEQKARQIVVSPEDFNGYHGDGATDDYAAFQRAMDYLLARGGGVLRVPPRSHLLSQSAIYPGNALTVRGDSHGGSWIINGSANMPAFQIGVPGSTGYRNEVNGVVFGQKAGVIPVLGNCGLLALNQSNIAVDRVQTFQFPSRLYDGVVFDRVAQSYLSNFGLQEAVNRGLAMTNQSLDIYAVNGRCDGNGTGVEFRDVQGMYFSSVSAYGNLQHAISMVTDFPASPAQANRYFQFFNVVGDTSGSHNWNIRQLSLANLVACWAATQLSQTTNTESDGFFLSGENVEDITMIAPMAASNNRHGINLDNCRSVVVDSGRMGSAAFPEDWGGDGANNGKGGYGSGLFIGAGSNFTTVTGGHYQNNTDHGIAIAAGAQRVRVTGVDVQFNQKEGIRNLANATSAQARITDCAGHNPLGFFAAPAVPASGVAVPNLSGVDCMVYIAGGTISSVSISGQEVLGASNASVLLAAGDSITITYSSAPTWTWRGN